MPIDRKKTVWKAIFTHERSEDGRQEKNKKEEPTEILAGILAGQIEMDTPIEAIRAQAVLVRTEYVRREAAGETQERSLSMEDMASLWGSGNLQSYYEIAIDKKK